MLLHVSAETDVYFHLATEEYLLKNRHENILMLWRSNKSVVCGKHQNLCAEVNYGYCRENGIDTARRLSGGGTVFHDMGNLNFTFIRNLPQGIEKAVDFRQFLDPVIQCLQTLNLDVTYSGRNDLLLNGFKISGNAEHVDQKNKRVLHHGTLLFDSQLHDLRNALHTEGSYESKAVKSVRSEVTNIRPWLATKMDISAFIAHIANHFLNQGAKLFDFSETDKIEIQTLRNEKYAAESWYLGYSPKYKHHRNFTLNNQEYTLMMETDRGMIQQCEITDSDNQRPFQSVLDKLLNQTLTEKTILDFLSKHGLSIDPWIFF
ncbi:MAG: lipoate--protein ligase [Bacteroidetes bacterium]|nr:lipoate--protein ligase [Bacteroidota bacterium]